MCESVSRVPSPSVDLGPLTQFLEISTLYQEFPVPKMKVVLKTIEQHPPYISTKHLLCSFVMFQLPVPVLLYSCSIIQPLIFVQLSYFLLLLQLFIFVDQLFFTATSTVCATSAFHLYISVVLHCYFNCLSVLLQLFIFVYQLFFAVTSIVHLRWSLMINQVDELFKHETTYISGCKTIPVKKNSIEILYFKSA